MSTPSTFAILVLFFTLGFTLWGGFVFGPGRIVPLLLLLGPLLLPAFARFDVPGLPPLTRTTAVTAPTLLLFLFTPRANWRRFRWVWCDVLLAAFVSWTVACVAVNQGSHAAASMALSQLLHLAVPYFAGRLYLQRGTDLVQVVRVLVPFAIVYLALMVFEARLYPRFQRWVYDAEVVGLYRFGLYRPVVFAENQLELGHMFVLLTTLMVAVYRVGGEVRRAAGGLLGFGIAAGCIGVALSLSRGPIVALTLALAVPLLLRRTGPASMLLGAIGVVFFLWMLRPNSSSVLAGLALADQGSEAGQTLFFRFLQIEEWKPLIAQSCWFGWGEAWQRSEYAIIDGELLLTALGYGYPGVLLLAAFWLSFVWWLGRGALPRRHAFEQLGAALAPVLGFLVFSAWGDAFLRVPHYFVVGGALGLLASARGTAEEPSMVANPIRRVVLRFG